MACSAKDCNTRITGERQRLSYCYTSTPKSTFNCTLYISRERRRLTLKMFKLHLTRQRLRLSFKTGDVGSLSLNKKSLVKWI